MVNTLFLEDGDLLENVMISNQIYESEIIEFDRLISEQEMIISIYENQRFLIEQDTQIFMRLRYNTEVLSEGVLENIGKGIMAVLRKIGELISNFIGFIFGRRKKEKVTEKEFKKIEENEEKIVETIKETEKELKNTKSDLEKSIDAAREAGVDESKIMKTKEDLDKFFLEKEDGEYRAIIINDNTMKNLNITKKWTELEDMIQVLEQCINALKRNDPNGIPKTLQDKYQNYKKSLDIQKEDSESEKIVGYKCDRDTYYKMYHKSAEAFYKNYTDESVKNLSFLKQMKSKIDALSNQIKSIQDYNQDKNNALVNTAKTVGNIVTSISQDCNRRIQTLVNIEQGYQAYKYNIRITASQYIKVDKTTNKVSKDIKDMKFDEFDKNMSDKNLKLVFDNIGARFEKIDVEGIKKHNPGLVEDMLRILK